MNDQLKQRLVGAIVLVSLAVIFIPMILPGGGGLGNSIDGREVPAEPDYRFPPPKPAPKAPPIGAAPVVPMGESGEASSGMPSKKADKKISKPIAAAKPAASVKARATSETTTTKAKSVEVKSGQGSAWIVQVGSFTSAPNAKALRDKLRKMGYASFVEAIKGKQGMIYRVRVGPELTRELAEKLQKKLAKKTKLKGLVQSYP